jgi:DNA-binding MarR family transcriptional regulator
VPKQTLHTDLGNAIMEWCRLLAREGVHVNRTWLSVLATLRGGPRRVGDLAASEFVSQPGMTTLLSRLEEEGWVVRRADATDGRVVNVAITPAGRKMLQSAIDARNDVVRQRVERLGARDRRALEGAVATLRKLLD